MFEVYAEPKSRHLSRAGWQKFIADVLRTGMQASHGLCMENLSAYHTLSGPQPAAILFNDSPWKHYNAEESSAHEDDSWAVRRLRGAACQRREAEALGKWFEGLASAAIA